MWSVYRVESEDWARKKIVLDRSATFLKKYENQDTIDYEGAAEYTSKDFEHNAHEFEEIYDDSQSAHNYNLRHTTREGNTIETTPSGRALRSCELDDLTPEDIYSSDDETIGFDPASNQWIPQLPRLKKKKTKRRAQKSLRRASK